MEQFGKPLLIAGTLIFLLGLLFTFSGKFPESLRPGSLPLDIKVQKENFSFYFPLGTSILLSLLLTLAFALFRR